MWRLAGLFVPTNISQYSYETANHSHGPGCCIRRTHQHYWVYLVACWIASTKMEQNPAELQKKRSRQKRCRRIEADRREADRRETDRKEANINTDLGTIWWTMKLLSSPHKAKLLFRREISLFLNLLDDWMNYSCNCSMII